MNRYLKIALIAGLVLITTGAIAAGVVYAQSDDPPHPREALAELLGLSEEELREQLREGASLEELAEQAGVDLEAFREEMAAIRKEHQLSRLAEALEEGEISQEQYDWMLEGFEGGFLDHKGCGEFFGGEKHRNGEGNRQSGEGNGLFDQDRPGRGRNRNSADG